MAIEAINLGASPDDGTGDSARDAGTKINANFAELSKGQIAGEIRSPTARTYTVDLSAPIPYTITGLTVQTTAGTVTCAVQINGADVTGLSAVNATISVSANPATGNNVVAQYQRVTLVLSNPVDLGELLFAIRTTRN